MLRRLFCFMSARWAIMAPTYNEHSTMKWIVVQWKSTCLYKVCMCGNCVVLVFLYKFESLSRNYRWKNFVTFLKWEQVQSNPDVQVVPPVFTPKKVPLKENPATIYGLDCAYFCLFKISKTFYLQSLSGYQNRYPGYLGSSSSSLGGQSSQSPGGVTTGPSSITTSRAPSVSSVKSCDDDSNIDYKKVQGGTFIFGYFEPKLSVHTVFSKNFEMKPFFSCTNGRRRRTNGCAVASMTWKFSSESRKFPSRSLRFGNIFRNALMPNGCQKTVGHSWFRSHQLSSGMYPTWWIGGVGTYIQYKFMQIYMYFFWGGIGPSACMTPFKINQLMEILYVLIAGWTKPSCGQGTARKWTQRDSEIE